MAVEVQVPAPSTARELRHLEHRIAAELGGPARLGVAFSGGVDSAVVLAVAARALGPQRVLAVLGVSPSLAADERELAHRVAEQIGVPLVEVATAEGEVAAYRANGPDRCFHCKDELFTRISDEVATRHGLDVVAYGENADDARRSDRPGSAAAARHGVLRPLAAAGATKAQVRALARAFGLEVADKPAAPCLASRIPHFEEVTPAKLGQVERAEAGAEAARVDRQPGPAPRRGRSRRADGRTDLVAAVQQPLRDNLVAAVREAGFRFVTLDLAGIQSGAFTLSLVSARG